MTVLETDEMETQRLTFRTQTGRRKIWANEFGKSNIIVMIHKGLTKVKDLVVTVKEKLEFRDHHEN